MSVGMISGRRPDEHQYHDKQIEYERFQLVLSARQSFLPVTNATDLSDASGEEISDITIEDDSMSATVSPCRHYVELLWRLDELEAWIRDILQEEEESP